MISDLLFFCCAVDFRLNYRWPHRRLSVRAAPLNGLASLYYFLFHDRCVLTLLKKYLLASFMSTRQWLIQIRFRLLWMNEQHCCISEEEGGASQTTKYGRGYQMLSITGSSEQIKLLFLFFCRVQNHHDCFKSVRHWEPRPFSWLSYVAFLMSLLGILKIMVHFAYISSTWELSKQLWSMKLEISVLFLKIHWEQFRFHNRKPMVSQVSAGQ